MTTPEKWNLIVSNVQKGFSAKEAEVQQLWENFFADANLFGYSRFSGEIDSQRNITIGSSERTIPDIIIKDNISNKDLFVIELKQHNLSFNQAYKKQLFSYMRLLRLNIGILICNKIYLFILDYDDNETSMEITFTKDNPNGSKFIELFSKGDFNQEKIKAFLIETEKTKSNINRIKKDIQQLDIKDLLIEHYSDKYTIEEIRAATEHLRISIEFDNEGPIKPPVPPFVEPNSQPQPIRYDKIGKSEAIRIFINLGYSFPSKPTYASKNKTANNYWANPDITVLNNDWYMILNDWISKTLYLFVIPYNSITLSKLTTRNDNQNKIDLQIIYNDPSFTDSRSGVSFKQYLQREYKY